MPCNSLTLVIISDSPLVLLGCAHPCLYNGDHVVSLSDAMVLRYSKEEMLNNWLIVNK